MLENKIERLLCKNVKKRNGIIVKLNSASMAGLPDRLVIFPKGKIYFVELKAPGKKLRPLQQAVHKLLRDIGCNVFVLDSSEKVGEFINGI